MKNIQVTNKETTDNFKFNIKEDDYIKMTHSHRNINNVEFKNESIEFIFFIDFKDFEIELHEFRNDLEVSK